MPRHKDVVCVGRSLRDLKTFPLDARRTVGFQLDLLPPGQRLGGVVKGRSQAPGDHPAEVE